MNNTSLITSLLNTWQSKQNEELQDNTTFFEILGRAYDEDLISRMLAYAFKNDELLLKNVLEFYFGKDLNLCTVDSVECEKAMLGGRADIFITAHNSKGTNFTVTVENKIYSWEHSEQTNTYYDFVEKQFSDSRNAYIFLKPVFNASLCSCKHFKILTYASLSGLISNTKDDKIADLKKHIEKFLSFKEVKFMDIDIQVLKNYGVLKSIIKSAENKFDAFKKQFISDLCNNKSISYANNSQSENDKLYLSYNPFNKNDVTGYDILSADTLVAESTNENKYIRFYRKKWYSGKSVDENEKYYFYVEIVFEDNAPNEIKFQNVIKKYGRTDTNNTLVKFLSDKNYNLQGTWYNQWFVLAYPKNFIDSENEILTEQWRNNLKSYAISAIEELISEMDKTFEAFEAYKINNI